MATQQYDAIILGGGPNGLTCAAYLARAGARVLVVERRHETGGGLVTEDHAGFRFDFHATYMMLAELMPPYGDLQLEGQGVAFTRPAVQAAFLFKDGSNLTLYADPDLSAKSVSKLSPRDEKPFRQMFGEFKAMCDEVIIPATYVPPMPVLEQVMLLNKSDLGRRLAEISEMSPKDIIDSYGFQDPRVKAAVTYLGVLWGIDPEAGGVGFMVPLYLSRMLSCALVRGGSHSLSSGIQRVLVSSGGTIEEWAEPVAVKMDEAGGGVVKLADGRQFRGRAIVSTLNPEQTFLQLLKGGKVPPEVADAAKIWQWEEWSLFTMHLAAKGDPPRYKAAERDAPVNEALLTVMGFETPEDIYRHIREVKAGRLPEPAGHVSCTSLYDPLRAPPGPYGPYHTIRWESWAPYQAAGGKPWDDVKEEYADRCFQRWQEYAPNLDRRRMLMRFVWSPVDIERRFPDMKGGSIKQGAYISLQMGYFRPNDRCSTCRTPIAGLYLAGACVYPGGMVTLGPGYNAANVVAEDLGLKKAWTPPDYVTRAIEKGYLPS